MITLGQRLREETGEGVISTGIAILIMAVIGGLMFVAFSSTLDDTSDAVDDELTEIVDGGS